MPCILVFDLSHILAFDLPTILLYAILLFRTETSYFNKIVCQLFKTRTKVLSGITETTQHSVRPKIPLKFIELVICLRLI